MMGRAVAVALGLAALADVANADVVCRKKKGQLLARPACKSKEAPLGLETVLAPGDGLALTGNTLGIADGGVAGGKLADGAVTTAKIGDGSVTADKIADHTRSVYIPAAALSYDDNASDPFTRTALGLRVVAHAPGNNGNPPPFVVIVPRPPDIDAASPVGVHVYVMFTSSPAANNDMVRLRFKQYATDLGPGGLANAAWTDAASPSPVTGSYEYARVDFTLLDEYAALPIWYLQFGRGDVLNGENFTSAVVIPGVELTYTAVQ
jgi:hypothetical protein